MSLQSFLAHLKKHITFILVGIIAILVMEYFGFFLGISNYCYDAFFRLRGPVRPPQSIVLVAIDEKTLDQLGRWPLQRRYYARLFERLTEASVIGLDILMIEPSADDALVADALARRHGIVFPSYISKGARNNVPSSSIFNPQSTGHIHLEQDIDGVVRKVYHTLYHGDRKLVSFTSLLFEKRTNQSFPRTPFDSRDAGWSVGRSSIIQMDMRTINYYGPQGTFPIFSFSDVVGGKYEASFFKDKIVLVGVTAEGLEAGVLTPFSQERNHMSGVEAHAHILGNLIDGSRMIAASNALVWFISFGLSCLCLFLFLRGDGWRTTVLWLIAMMAVGACSFVLFTLFDFWFSPIPFALLLLLMFFIAYIFRMEEARKALSNAKELWEDSFNTIDDAIMVLDNCGKPLQMNGAADRMQKENQQLLAAIASKMPVDPAGFRQEKKLNQAETGADALVSDEIADPDRDRYYAVKRLPRYDCLGRPIGFVQVIQDITQQKKIARERQRLEYELMQAQKMEAIGTLAGGVAHDFNNILMGIGGYVSLLQMDINTTEHHIDKLRKIEAQVQSAAQLTRQLLGFARGGKYEVKLTNLNDLIADSSDVFGRTKKELTINLRFEDKIWLVMVDRGQVAQVLLNMYINSWQAMPGGGDLYIETQNVVLTDNDVASHSVKPGRYVKISMTDTGTGMDEITQKRVFEPFFTTKEKGKGTGLGLASAYGIIKNHGGFIDVRSEIGKGATFSVYLPAAEEDKKESPDAPERKIYRGKGTILVVDDEPMNVMVMQELLQSLGYDVICAGSGQEAMSIYMVKKGQIDLVILDMIMPGMGGSATFDALRGLNPELKIILSSGYSADGEARKILDRGCNGFIQKPFLLNELSQKIREVM